VEEGNREVSGNEWGSAHQALYHSAVTAGEAAAGGFAINKHSF